VADYAVNFRSSAGYVTDGAGETYCLHVDAYPTTRGGGTFGWVDYIGVVDGRDRNSGNDPRLAGINFAISTAPYWRLDLAAGDYDVRMGSAEPGGGTSDADWLLQDGTTTFVTLSEAVADAMVVDATDVETNYATWLAAGGGNAVARTFAGDHFRLKSNGTLTRVCHVRLTTAAAGFDAAAFPHARPAVQLPSRWKPIAY
jgi:hypothetical protein